MGCCGGEAEEAPARVCSSCCSKFWQSIPYATVLFHTLALVGAIGFAVAGAQAVVALGAVPHLQHLVTLFGSSIGVVVGVTLLPLVLTFAFAVCATGYVREVVKGTVLTSCIGYSCSAISILLLMMAVLLWLLVCVGMACLVTIYVEVEVACQQVLLLPGLTDAQRCLPTASLFNVTSSDICKGSGLEELCKDGVVAGIAFSISLGFGVVVTTGLVILLVVQTCNFVKVREVSHYHRSYDVSDS